ncbi:PQQ-binding-like beta-propeller repeat protein [bacterium]|nr:PQQ-binding-like beta-propeller repeat protein [bacterium]
MKRYITPAFIALALVLGSCDIISRHPSFKGGDWPQYRANAGRTGYAPFDLPENLSLRWKYVQSVPVPAWKAVHTRMTFDHAYEPVIAGNTLFFGSSADGKIYAIDTLTGAEKWTFYTGGPVRFAPAVWKKRVYAISDDGYIYCLSEENGSLDWKKRGGSSDDMILGNDRMISRWPARGGVVIRDNVLYFGAGIWPSEGVFIYALNPDNGKVLWVNNDSGGLETDQPNSAVQAKSGISAQGYLTIAGSTLFVPTGRAVPAACDLKTGKLKCFHIRKYRNYGGSRIMADDPYLFITGGNARDFREITGTRNALFNMGDGELATTDEFNSNAMVVSPKYVFYIDSRDGELKAIERGKLLVRRELSGGSDETVSRAYLNEPAWSLKIHEPEAVSLIAAGDKIVAGTINNRVTVINTGSKTVVWSADVDGIPYGLAVAHGRLYVSTDRGTIYCFDGNATAAPSVVQHIPVNYPYGTDKKVAAAAREIIEKTGITDGYCLDVGCGDGKLTYELARRTNLRIIAVDQDQGKVDEARTLLDKAGLYGPRVTVLKYDLSALPLPGYFANLIVSGNSVSHGADAVKITNVFRMLHPYGGKACFGKPGSMEVSERERLDGAGEWTHRYHDPANSLTSEDDLVQGNLDVLWFRDPDFGMPSRHGRGIGPLFSDGRLFVQGVDGIRAYDAYNGAVLWELYIEDIGESYGSENMTGAALANGNWCIGDKRLYVRTGNQQGNPSGRSCLVIDTATGNPITTCPAPSIPDTGTRGHWGYIAYAGGTIFGSIANDEHIADSGYGNPDSSTISGESAALFAMDAETGRVKWTYKAQNSVRNNSIAIGNGYVYLIDRPLALIDRAGFRPEKGKMPPQTAGTLVALDAETGQVVYRKRNVAYGTLLALSVEHDILVMTGESTRSGLPSGTGVRMSAFRAADGALLWEVKTGSDDTRAYPYSSRPIINDTTIYLEPGAWDLLTGERLDFGVNRSYACGILAGLKNMMVFRSATLGYFDLTEQENGTQNYGDIRPGCWINAIPAGGLVLMPDIAARCECSYFIKADIAFIPRKNPSVQ